LCAEIQDFQLSLSEILCVRRVLCGSDLFAGESYFTNFVQIITKTDRVFSPFRKHLQNSDVTIQPSTRNRGVTANERFLRVKQSPKAWFFLFNTRLLRAKNALAMTA
jgi:hypothetical protein